MLHRVMIASVFLTMMAGPSLAAAEFPSGLSPESDGLHQNWSCERLPGGRFRHGCHAFGFSLWDAEQNYRSQCPFVGEPYCHPARWVDISPYMGNE